MKKCLQGLYTAYVVLLFLATLLVVLPFYFLLSLRKQRDNALWRLTHIWARIWSAGAGLRVTTYGNWPPPGSVYVIVANHASYLDPVSLFAAVPFPFRPLAKQEISKAPLFGYIYARIAIMVDRSSLRKKAESMREMDTALRSGQSIFVYPEGTFNETDAPTLPFFDGAFRLAIEHQVPILPLIFPDTRERWHYTAWWKLWPGKNRLYLLDAVPVSGLELTQVASLREKIRKEMEIALIKAASE